MYNDKLTILYTIENFDSLQRGLVNTMIGTVTVGNGTELDHIMILKVFL